MYTCTCTTTRVSSDHTSYTFFYYCFCVLFETKLFFCFVCGVSVFFFFVASSLAVFQLASVFNQDVSKWNTSAVTSMCASKCNLSPSLWPRLLLLCFLNFEYTPIRVSSDHNSHTFYYFCFVFGRSLVLLLHPFLQCFMKHVRSIRTCRNGIQVR